MRMTMEDALRIAEPVYSAAAVLAVCKECGGREWLPFPVTLSWCGARTLIHACPACRRA